MRNSIQLFILILIFSQVSFAKVNFDLVLIKSWYLHHGFSNSDFMQVEDNPFGPRRALFIKNLETSGIPEKELIGFSKAETVKNRFNVSITFYFNRATFESMAALKQNNQNALVFLTASDRNFSESKKILEGLTKDFRFLKKSKVSLHEYLLPKASAQEPCALASSQQSNLGAIASTNQVVGEKVMGLMMNCARNVVDGVWDSTGGRLSSAAECFKAPIQCARSSIESLKNVYQLMGNLKDSLMKLNQYLSNEDLSSLACSMAGSLGTDLLIAAATSGVGSAKVALTMTSLTNKLASLLKLLAKTGKLKVPIDLLAKYSSETLEKITDLLQKGKINTNQLESKLLMCAR